MALCIGSVAALQWAAERFSLKFPLYIVAPMGIAIAFGIGGLAVAFVWAGLSDATGSGLVASLLLVLIASAVGNVVLAAQRQDYLATDHKLEFLRDWMWSVAMVIGGLFLTMLPSFQIGFLLVALAEHRLLPTGLSNAILSARSQVMPWSWLALQSCSVLAMVVWIYRFGVGRAVEAFGVMVLAGLVSLGLSFIAFVAVIALAPPPH
jgi:hypothetical protein